MFSPFRTVARRGCAAKLPGLRRVPPRGFLLVVVLALLVLMLGLALAFFSMAQLNQSSNNSSAARRQAELLAGTAEQILIDDFLHEVAAGSAPDTFLPGEASSRKVYQPLTVDTTNSLIGAETKISTAPSLLPQRVVATGSTTVPVTLVKQSVRDRPFFVESAGVTNSSSLPPIPNRASSISTTEPSANGQRIVPTRWSLPGFARDGESVPAPDWVYLNRDGNTPRTFSGTWGDNSRGNGEYILGRFAYTIYEVGGLLDINLVGNRLDPQENARRGKLHQVSLPSSSAGLAVPDFAEFVAWRSSLDADASMASGALFDPRRDFSKTPPGSQALVGRNDLLQFVRRPDSPLPAEALPFLTTFGYELNAPSHAPEPNRPLLPADPPADEMNPALCGIRFAVPTVLTRGSDPDVTVPAGTPVMVRRFPLSKLAVLAEENPDPETLKYYFGLEKQPDGTFRYTETADLRIKRLQEVAAEGREPNFFEVLQAAVVTGSLGRDAGNAYTINVPYDANRYYQVITIGANIIDQWDTDDYPTTVSYPLGNAGEYHSCHGVENLPYFNNVLFVGHRPPSERDRFQVWAHFDVWNPHQNAVHPPAGIDAFRILPRGKARTDIRYSIPKFYRPFGTDPEYTAFNNATSTGGTLQDIGTQSGALNHNRELTFPNAIYSQPSEVGGGPPEADGTWATYAGGLLINNYPGLGVAVPEVVAAGDPRRALMNAALEHYGLSRLPPDGTGKWGVKAHNYFRVRSGTLETEKISFDLQYRTSPGGPWKTYQTIQGVLPSTNDPGSTMDLKGLSDGSDTVNQDNAFSQIELEKATHHSMASPVDPEVCYYGWRNGSVAPYSVNMSKMDPRTMRFGLNGNTTAAGTTNPNDPLGSTIAQSTNPYAGSNDREQFNWRIWKSSSNIVIGRATSDFGSKGFEWRIPTLADAAFPFALIRNIPEGSVNSTTNPGRYQDLDGLIRPADGYLGTLPTAMPVPASGKGSLDDRPVVLNRPFRSVGEMGYAFRDLPWKTLDFSTANSGDLALLDVFSTEETDGPLPLLPGKVNINTAPPEVLATLLVDTGKKIDNSSVALTMAEAESIAAAIVQARTQGPFRTVGDLVSRVLTPLNASSTGVMAGERKTEREAAIRTLAAMGQTRTWNFLIDLVVQSGRFPASANSGAGFVVQAETRYFVHLALDRFTGRVIAIQREKIHE